MAVMGIETSGNLCSVAFCRGETILAEYNHEIPMKHTELVGELIRIGINFIEREVSADETVDLTAVAIGPGSFTGLRIGLSYAQGFCFGRDIPIVGVSNQQILAAQSVTDEDWVYTAIDARRGEYFIAKNRKIGGRLSEIEAHDIVKGEQLSEYFPDRAEIIFKSGVELEPAVRESLKGKDCLLHFADFSGALLAKLGREKFERKGGDDADTIEPMYIRPFAGVK